MTHHVARAVEGRLRRFFARRADRGVSIRSGTSRTWSEASVRRAWSRRSSVARLDQTRHEPTPGIESRRSPPASTSVSILPCRCGPGAASVPSRVTRCPSAARRWSPGRGWRYVSAGTGNRRKRQGSRHRIVITPSTARPRLLMIARTSSGDARALRIGRLPVPAEGRALDLYLDDRRVNEAGVRVSP